MALPEFGSLKSGLKNYVDNPYSRRTLAPYTREILEFAYKQVQLSEKTARKLLLSSTSRLDFQIKVAVSKLLHKMYALTRDVQYSTLHIEFPKDQLEDLKRDMESFAEMLENMAVKFAVSSKDDDHYSSRIHEPKMVGLHDQYEQLKDRLTRYTGLCVPLVAVLVGMPGIGKSTLASKVFEDPSVVARYAYRVWVTVGRKGQPVRILRSILAAVDPVGSDQVLARGEYREIALCLSEKLKGKRYLIVLDDVWNRYMACSFRSYSEYNSFPSDPFPFPFEADSGLVLITTRIQQQEEHGGKFPDHVLKVRLLDKKESWDLLRQKVFPRDQSCPPQLEKYGKMIAENCQGLPLTILTVADLLSKEETTPQYWKCVAAKKNHKIFMDAYQKISKVLYSSYEELTHELRMCFLYMGVFPQDLEIPRSKIINMWNVDGFLEKDVNAFQNPSAIECLHELVFNSLVMIYQSTIGLDKRVIGRHQIKTCGLHSSLWYLSRREASDNKFCHVLNVVDDCSSDYLQGQSRVSFHNNILFGIKDVHLAVESECASTAHSLLCYGPYHQYQVPLCFGLELLQQLDALTIRFYEFPEDVLQLVELKYLALTLNREIPASISKLSKLQILIVGRHMRIISPKDSSYLPLEIWDMKELKHLQVMRSNLPDPRGFLENLTTLSDVSGQSCREGVFKAMPNLKKLGIRVELSLNDGGNSLSCLDHIRHLEKLESLKCVIVNPACVVPIAPQPVFPKDLRKLTLSGLWCSWEKLSNISSLLWLQVLKLRNYAFVGPTWEVTEKGFRWLESLLIEDTDLEEWTIGSESMNNLRSLRIKHCYKLKRIQWESDRPRVICHWACHSSLEKIELEDCNPSGVEAMKMALPHWKQDALAVYSSWKDKKLKT